MKNLKPFVRIIGFIPAMIYSCLVLLFLFNVPILSLIPAIIATICLFLAPIFLIKEDWKKWIGVIAVICVSTLLFIEASSSQAFSPQYSMSLGILNILFFTFYYIILRKKVIA